MYFEADRADLALPLDRGPAPLLLVDAQGTGRLVLPFARRKSGKFLSHELQSFRQALERLNSVTVPAGPGVWWLTGDGLVATGRVSDSWVARRLFDNATVLLPPPA
jgi:hypothetical protein